MKRMLLVICLASMLITPASAWQLSDVVLAGNAGSGSLTSYVVIDFGVNSYAFSYKYDGAKTGYDMLQALEADVPGFAITVDDYGGGSIFLNTVAYGGDGPVGGVAPSYWSYWLGTFDGSPVAWAFSGVGAGARNLTDGSWDGWSFVPDWNFAAEQPDVPLVPEPATLFTLGAMFAAGVLKIRKR